MSVAQQMNEQLTEAQERVLDGMEAAQTRIIEMNRRVADALPEGEQISETLRLESLPSMPSFLTLPEDLPKPTEMVDRYFDFTAKVAKANRDFYKEMLAIWMPESAPAPKKSTAKSGTAKKSTSKKSTAKKATSK